MLYWLLKRFLLSHKYNIHIHINFFFVARIYFFCVILSTFPLSLSIFRCIVNMYVMYRDGEHIYTRLHFIAAISGSNAVKIHLVAR